MGAVLYRCLIELLYINETSGVQYIKAKSHLVDFIVPQGGIPFHGTELMKQ